MARSMLVFGRKLLKNSAVRMPCGGCALRIFWCNVGFGQIHAGREDGELAARSAAATDMIDAECLEKYCMIGANADRRGSHPHQTQQQLAPYRMFSTKLSVFVARLCAYLNETRGKPREKLSSHILLLCADFIPKRGKRRLQDQRANRNNKATNLSTVVWTTKRKLSLVPVRSWFML